tara:strand:+ start:1061 stop:1249 length:189 start_codon:yes stop_codon:yes gene_type:complete
MREINIKVENITPKQWTSLVIELNLVSKAWKPYGPVLTITTANFDHIIKLGRKKHDESPQNE